MIAPRFLVAGDCALIVEFGDAITRALNEQVLALDRALAADPPAGMVETVPTIRSLLVHYDPALTTGAALEGAIAQRLQRPAPPAGSGRLWRFPTCYGGAHARDLDELAARVGLGPQEVAARHAATSYHVYMLGFTPGFAYMGDLPAALVTPRRATPRVRLPAGSVAVATSLTAVYPQESPGGWWVIGATPVRLFNPARPSPALLRPGDRVAFEPIAAHACAMLAADIARDRWRPAYETIDA